MVLAVHTICTVQPEVSKTLLEAVLIVWAISALAFNLFVGSTDNGAVAVMQQEQQEPQAFGGAQVSRLQ